MNVSITIPETSPHFAAVLALLAGTSAAALSAAPIAGADDDSDAGTPAAPGQTNARGIPWSEAVHSTPPSLTAKGEWRKKRGATDADIAAYEATFAQQQPAPVAFDPASMPQMPVPVAAMQPYVPAQMPAPVAMPQMVAHVPQQQPAPVAMPEQVVQQAAPTDFQGFMQHITMQMAKTDASGFPLINADILAALTQQIASAFTAQGHNVQLSVITDIAAHPLSAQLTAYAQQLLQSQGRW